LRVEIRRGNKSHMASSNSKSSCDFKKEIGLLNQFQCLSDSELNTTKFLVLKSGPLIGKKRNFILWLYTTLLRPTKSKMKKIIAASRNNQNLCLLVILFAATSLCGCQEKYVDRRIKQMDPAKTARIAASIESVVKPELADGLTLRLWGVDSLVVSPIAIDIDDSGKIYYCTTNRQKILNLIFAVIRIGRYHPYNYKRWRIREPSCIKSCHRKTVRTING